MFKWLKRWLAGPNQHDKTSDALSRAEALRLRALDQYLAVMTTKRK